MKKKKVINKIENQINIILIQTEQLKENQKRDFLNDAVAVVGMISSILVVLAGVISYFAASGYANECADYYGISREYFWTSKPYIEKALIFVIYVCICPVLIFTTGWIGRTENKLQRMLIGIGTFANFVLVSLACSQSIWKWMLETGVYSDIIAYVDIVFSISASAVIVNSFLKILNDKSYCKKNVRHIFILIAMVYYFGKVLFTIALLLNQDVSNTKTYETISEIVAEYESRFVVMECDVEEEVLRIHKGEYRIVDMQDKPIKSRTYVKCICE